MRHILYTAILSLVVVLTVLAPFPSFGAEPVTKFTWNAPTAFTDGSPLTATIDLAGYTFNCGSVTYVTLPTNDVSEELLMSEMGFTDGAYTCTVKAIDKDGNESAPSDPAPEVVAAGGNFFLRGTGVPAAPTRLLPN